MIIPMRYVLLTCLIAVVVPGMAWASVDFDLPPIVINNGGDSGDSLPTPLLKKSDVVRVPIQVHYPNGIGGSNDPFGFAGYLVRAHILDGNELNHDPSPFVPIPGFGAGYVSGNAYNPRNGINIPNSRQASSARTGAIWLPTDLAQESGVELPASFQAPVMDLFVHAKNTEINPDPREGDIEVQVFNIRHARSGGSVDVQTSSWVFLPDVSFASGNTPDPLPSALQPNVNPSTGHWIHLSQSKVFDISPSAYIATLAGTALVDIRHIPEPASGLMIVGGISAIVFGLRSRKNRVA